jgi:hypothetical protein
MSSSDPPPNFRPSFDNCDGVSDLCPVSASLYGSLLSQPGNAVLLSVFSICLVLQIANAIYTRTHTYSYTICLLAGTICEILGYAGRLILHTNPWEFNAFAMQMCCLIVGPAFIAAAMSITFKHLITYVGPKHSVLKPRLYPWVFVGTDFASIVIQGMGGGIASAGSNDAGGNRTLLDVGDNMLLAGVAFQVANMVGCGLLMLIYVWRYKKAKKAGREQKDTDYVEEKGQQGVEKKLHMFCWAIVAAYLAVLARCIYRLPEFASGWGSDLQQNETTFLILDGAMIASAVIVLTFAHPHWWFPAMERYSRSKKTRAKMMAARGGESASGDEPLERPEEKRDNGPPHLSGTGVTGGQRLD